MFSKKRIFNLVIGLGFGLLFAACGSFTSNEISTPVPTESQAATPSQNDVQIEIKLFNFQDKEITIPAGTRVTWINKDGSEHSVTSGTPENPDSAFDSDFFNKDATFSMVFDTPGEYHYFCRRHNHMQGVVIVTSP